MQVFQLFRWKLSEVTNNGTLTIACWRFNRLYLPTRKIHFEVLILKENFGIFKGIFMGFREFIRDFGDFCLILSDFREFSGV